MALLFCDGFEYLDKPHLLSRWSSCSDMDSDLTTVHISASGEQYVKSGDYSLKLRAVGSTNIAKALPEKISTVIAGFAVYHDSDLNSCQGWTIENAGGTQLTIFPKSDGSIEVRRGTTLGTLLNTSATDVILTDTWQFVEFKVYVADSGGYFYVRVDGEHAVSGESLDTKYQSTDGITLIRWASNTQNVYYDDVYILDTLGGVNDDFLGPMRVDTLLPNGAGNYTNWDPSAGSNYQCVDDDPKCDDDTTYVQTMSGEVIDTYTFADLTELTVDNIAGVMLFAEARRTAETAERLDLFARINGSDYSGETDYLSLTYSAISRVWDVNPDDSAQWELADVNDGEFGIKKIGD